VKDRTIKVDKEHEKSIMFEEKKAIISNLWKRRRKNAQKYQ
jgi:hypothetical protein